MARVRLPVGELAGELAYLFLLSVVILSTMQLSLVEFARPLREWWTLEWRAVPFNLLVIALPLALARCALRKRDTAALALAGTAALCYLNYRKLSFLHEPLCPSDLFKLSFLPFMMKFFTPWEYLALAGLLLMPAGALFLGWKRSGAKGGGFARSLAVVAILGSLFLAAFVGAEGEFPGARLRGRLFPDVFRDTRAAEVYGFFLNFALSSRILGLPEPSGYSEALVHRDLGEIPPAGPAGEERDVVVVLLESFYDLPRREQLSFSADFLPFYHSLRKEAWVFESLTPKSGGGTANAEYEVLTGMPVHVLPGGGVPYEQFVRRKIPSIVSFFAGRGYATVALHPWSRRNWNRDAVYPLLGFQQFIGGEDLPPGASDETIFRRSLELLRRPGGRRQLQFLATADTHAPYVKLPGGPAWLAKRPGDPALGDQIDAYATAMNVLDGRLAAYFRELRKLPRAPLVVLFGDHQPEFTGPLEAGKSDGLALYRNEVLIWGARGPTPKGAEVPAQDLYCVAPKVLAEAVGAESPYFQFVENFCEKQGSLWHLSGGGVPIREAFRRFSYDRLSGGQFSWR